VVIEAIGMTEETQGNRTIRLSADGIYRGASVHMPYPLEDSDFLKITKVTSFIPIWAHTFFTGTAIFLITLIAKWLANTYWHGTNDISTMEIITLIILGMLALVFEVLYFCLPSDKKKTIAKISKYFDEHQPQAAGFGDD
jgi:hypothetical protein